MGPLERGALVAAAVALVVIAAALLVLVLWVTGVIGPVDVGPSHL